MGLVRNIKRVLLLATAGVILSLLVIVILRGTAEPARVLLPDGREFCIEAVTFGTNHVVGWNDWWLVPFRKILPQSAVQLLTPTRGQSRQATGQPALVVWVYARNAAGKYTDCQRVRASFIDESGDVYPANGNANSAFSGGFSREAYIFTVFPRRLRQLKLSLSPFRSQETATVLISNPARNEGLAHWRPESLPATHRTGGIELRLESLVVQTNGGPQRWWEPVSLHWQPLFTLKEHGQPARGWQEPEWTAEDPTGNRGQTLGLHEPVQRFIATVYPEPDAVGQEARQWMLPVARLPTTPQGFVWNTNRVLEGASITVIGLFPPGAYTFSQGQLCTPPGGVSSMRGWTGLSKQVLPGKWQYWATHGATNFVAFLRWTAGKDSPRIAVGINYRQGQLSSTQWAHPEPGGQVTAFNFDPLPPDAVEIGLEIVLLKPLQTEFIAQPPLDIEATPMQKP